MTKLTSYNKTPRTYATTRTLDGDYVYRDIKITRLREHSVGVIFPDGRKKKYTHVRSAVEGINQYYRKNPQNEL